MTVLWIVLAVTAVCLLAVGLWCICQIDQDDRS